MVLKINDEKKKKICLYQLEIKIPVHLTYLLFPELTTASHGLDQWIEFA